jgi:hypothetical protein
VRLAAVLDEADDDIVAGRPARTSAERAGAILAA